MTDDPKPRANPDPARLMLRATELVDALTGSYTAGDRPAQLEDVADAVAAVLAFEPAHQQPALAARLVSETAAAGISRAGADVADALAEALTTTSTELQHALAGMRSGASLLTGYEPADLMVATLRDVKPDGAEYDDDGQGWATFKPGSRRVVLALRNDPHLNANTGRAMQTAAPKTP